MGEKASGNGEGSTKGLLRAFVAIDMPEEVRVEIRKIQKILRQQDLFEGTYVDPEHTHLTLLFIGYIEPVALAPIKKLLESVPFEPIEAKLGGVGAFGSKMLIKVVWLDLIGSGIADLARGVEKVLSFGKVARKRPFQSHVTLARVKKVEDAQALRDALEKIEVAPVSFKINGFVLKQSTLTSQGPIYVDLKRYGAEEE